MGTVIKLGLAGSSGVLAVSQEVSVREGLVTTVNKVAKDVCPRHRAGVQTWAPEPDNITFPSSATSRLCAVGLHYTACAVGSEHLNLWEDIRSAPRGCHCLTDQLGWCQGPDASSRPIPEKG